MSHRHLKSVTYFDVKQVLTTWLNLMMEALMEQWFHDSLTSARLLLFTEFSSALLVAVQRRLLNERGENDCNCTLSVFSVGLSSCRSGLASIGPINFVDLVIFAAFLRYNRSFYVICVYVTPARRRSLPSSVVVFFTSPKITLHFLIYLTATVTRYSADSDQQYKIKAMTDSSLFIAIDKDVGCKWSCARLKSVLYASTLSLWR